MKILSYNIHGCVGRNGEKNPAATLEVIKEINADMVALQEVEDHRELDKSFLRALDRLDYKHVIYGPTLFKPEGEYGNLFMSRFPMEKVERLDLTVAGREPRGAVRCELQIGQTRLKVTATHLGLTARERRIQLVKLLRERSHSKPKLDEDLDQDVDLFLGDFNEWFPLSCCNRWLNSYFGQHKNWHTFPARFPILKLDRIYVRPSSRLIYMHTHQSELSKRASDHLPLVAEIQLSWIDC